jgi:acetyl esterase/lipase
MMNGLFRAGHMMQDDDLMTILRREDNPLTTTQIVEAKDGDGNPMNIYITKPYGLKDAVNQPFINFLHGGAAVMFDAEMFNAHGLDKRWALLFNCPIVMPDFRNAPEIKQPKGMQDVAASVRFIYENAA